jgi:hypothetical protein
MNRDVTGIYKSYIGMKSTKELISEWREPLDPPDPPSEDAMYRKFENDFDDLVFDVSGIEPLGPLVAEHLSGIKQSIFEEWKIDKNPIEYTEEEESYNADQEADARRDRLADYRDYGDFED